MKGRVQQTSTNIGATNVNFLVQAEAIWFVDSFTARLARTAPLPAAELYDLGLRRAYRTLISLLCVDNPAASPHPTTRSGHRDELPAVLQHASKVRG